MAEETRFPFCFIHTTHSFYKITLQIIFLQSDRSIFTASEIKTLAVASFIPKSPFCSSSYSPADISSIFFFWFSLFSSHPTTQTVSTQKKNVRQISVSQHCAGIAQRYRHDQSHESRRSALVNTLLHSPPGRGKREIQDDIWLTERCPNTLSG